MPNNTTFRDLRSRQQNKARAQVVTITSGKAVERKAPSSAKSNHVTMPLLLENAPHAFLAHGGLNNLRNSFRLGRAKTLDMVLTGLCMAVTGPQERRRA